MTAGRPILVTGAYRSGTTITGQMLATSPELVYVQEPFNPFYFDVGVSSMRFERLFEHVTLENGRALEESMRRLCALEPNTAEALAEADSEESRAAAQARDEAWGAARAAGHRALLKDPIAFFAAPWISDVTGAQVVVTVRHPGSFVGSLKRLGWQTAVGDLLGQPDLAALRFPHLVESSRAYQPVNAELIGQAATFWNLVYTTAIQYREERPDWLFVRHEDISRAPVQTFDRLFGALGVPVSDAMRSTVEAYIAPGLPAEVPTNVTHAPVDGRRNAERWYSLLTQDEIDLVREITGETARAFYEESDWERPPA
ncbi:MAG: sulfotransferase [Planctomycetota bacterium]